ncbi:hypothetical protein METBIDRAFT_77284 [Metschnikowia bicuspidata var. bicuspidata NRRL YB-4993]|uniref:Zn(2)-C6 fungal-type domain-containing protein n=1 Tax=Metschnikowia bicuspidata var. bicuspidata NRRL YB-4993 TaxID=869754 RepID=A0A1A0HJZ4_9ASCO|nr:hypothetical protein METBIDRAFT_77284 [Metschnikowia bicuspidata var. bicuspidata NRRL YB-4993]OBA24499.1 hypothetical protein METBIDRAFT_77284 [Metschnikowia bicuspidata var. bicuspidata NRRL YB-4993]
MDKSKMKSILPKPSGSMLAAPASMMGSKRKSMSSAEIYSKRPKQSQSSPSPTFSSSMMDSVQLSPDDGESKDHDASHSLKQARPVTSCTFCRQHKIKCNASQNFPSPCTRCSKLGLKCEIDPQFKPKKGSQIQMLIGDVEELKAKIETLSQNEHLLTQALNQHNRQFLQPGISGPHPASFPGFSNRMPFSASNTPNSAMDQITGHVRSPLGYSRVPSYYPSPSGVMVNDATGPTSAVTSLNQVLAVNSADNSPATHRIDTLNKENASPDVEGCAIPEYSEFILGDVRLPLKKAEELHDKFMTKLVPFLPIISSRSASQLYYNSQLLFWTVMLTASLSEPEPTLYMSLASLIKQLAIETCWIRTPRSTHVIQALIILSIWPLPNEKVLDDCSYRFVGLAKNLSLQLGLHRGGEFIQEFSRTQADLGPESDLWRTRSWLAVFFCDHFWASTLGLPPSINTTDYLLENARIDYSLPTNFRSLISLSIFQCKLVNVMGISVTRSDGLLEPLNRAASLNILDRELERLKFKLNVMEGSSVEIYSLYIRLMICCFAFLPGTPIEDQVKYVSAAYSSATRIITIGSQILSLNSISLIELPIYVRQSLTYAAFILFKLHLSRYLIDKYVDSARQSIVTVHRLFRNTLSSWKDLQNDISRTSKVLEDLNIVLYTYPEIFIPNSTPDSSGSIISRMRSHLTASLFYDLVWCIHEARRRKLANKNGEQQVTRIKAEGEEEGEVGPRPQPLPFYNQITKDDFKTITTTTPSGTTITTLVPTDQALHQARSTHQHGSNKPLEINGIPLAMLEATGSTKDANSAEFSQPKQTQMELALYLAMTKDNMDIANAPVQFEDARLHTGGYPYNANSAPMSGMADQLDNFFQQQSHGWLNNNGQDDDFLGWIDVNMIHEK